MEEKLRRRRIAPLRKVQAEVVTDPAEQAEFDEERRRQPNVALTLGAAASLAIVELCRQLPTEERSSLLRQMAAGLSPEAQLDLLEELAADLPADLARRLEEQLRARLAK